MKHTTGREVFEKYGKVISFFIKILRLFPKPFLKLLYSINEHFNSKINILLRYCLLKQFVKKLGSNVYISKNVILKNIENLEIGDNVSIHEFSYIDAIGGIEIGNNVSISHNVSIISFDHGTDLNSIIPIKYQEIKKKKIIIGSNVWIGCGSRILRGSFIENNVIIGAQSVIKGKYIGNNIYINGEIKL